MSELVITAIGPDRPGIAADVSGHVHHAGANLADSRMINLRGHFALIALVEGSPGVLESVKTRLREAAPELGLSFDFSAETKGQQTRKGVAFRLTTYSMDQPGIVHTIANFLRSQEINIEQLETSLESAPFMGAPVFTMKIVMVVPSHASVSLLRRSLTQLADTLNCDIDLMPA